MCSLWITVHSISVVFLQIEGWVCSQQHTDVILKLHFFKAWDVSTFCKSWMNVNWCITHCNYHSPILHLQPIHLSYPFLHCKRESEPPPTSLDLFNIINHIYVWYWYLECVSDVTWLHKLQFVMYSVMHEGIFLAITRSRFMASN